MKFRLATLFLLLSLFAVSANEARACGSDDAEHTAKFHKEASGESCCTTDEAQPDCCADDAEHQRPDAGCPCDHENEGCHCPGCQILIHCGAAFTNETPPTLASRVLNYSVQKQAFYFADHLPEAVYLPIWQPPKIGA